MAMAMTATPNIIVVPATSDRPGFYANYASRSSFALGATQIVVGVLVAVVPWATLGYFGYVFLSLLFMSAGICGVAAGRVKKSCQIIGSMVVAIIAAVLAVPFFITYATFAADGERGYVEDTDYILAALFLIESVASIWSAAICCRSVCCGRRQTTGIPVQYQVQTGQVVMTMVNVAQAPQQQQPAVPDMSPPTYPGQGATAPAANAAYNNEAYELPPKY